MQTGRALSIASLGFGVVYFILGVTGLMWPATPATDVGLVSVTGVFVLMGALGLYINRAKPAA